MSSPKISIVTPCFNHVEFIRETIESVLTQSYQNFEYIIIDGGSSDGSYEVIKDYEDRLTYHISEKDQGQTDALIKGFSKATGDILCWLNSDDILESDAFKNIVGFFEQYPKVDFVYGNATWIDSKGKTLYKRKEMPFIRWIWFYAYNYIPQPSAFWRKQIYEDIGGINKNFTLAMDSDLFSRMANITNIVHIPIFLSRFRVHPEQRSTKQRMKLNEESSIIFNRELKRNISVFEKNIVGFFARCIRFIYRSLVLRSR